MPAIQLRRVPDDMHEQLRSRAKAAGMSLSEYVLSVLRRDLSSPTNREWFERVRQREPVLVDSAAALHEARAEREAQLHDAGRR